MWMCKLCVACSALWLVQHLFVCCCSWHADPSGQPRTADGPGEEAGYPRRTCTARGMQGACMHTCTTTTTTTSFTLIASIGGGGVGWGDYSTRCLELASDSFMLLPQAVEFATQQGPCPPLHPYMLLDAKYLCNACGVCIATM